MTIRRNITRFNFNKKNDTGRIKYIVVHYFGGTTTADNLAKYWAGKYVGASAHYAVGHKGEVIQIVEDGDIAWHCGAKSYVHPSCRNSNSIGIEMAVRKNSTATLSATDKDWYFTTETMLATVELTRELMRKYHVPVENIIRHHDVTGKICPNPYVYENTEHTWTEFKRLIVEGIAEQPPVLPAPSIQLPVAGGMEPYEIIIHNCNSLNIRPQPNTKQKEVGCISDHKRYTIVEEKNGWGRLKSGRGWIKLSYTKKVRG